MIPRRGLVSLALTLFGSALVVGFRTSDPTLLPPAGANLGLVPSSLAEKTAPPAAGVDPAATSAISGPISTLTPTATTPTTAISSKAAPATTPAAPSPAVAASGYRDGSYTGAGEQTPFEVIAVQVTIKGGKIVDVSPTTLSGSRGRSNQINNYAVPILRSEVLVAQSAQINAGFDITVA